MIGKKIKIFYDLETTGLDERKHSIIQLAGLVEINDEVVEEFDIKIKPHPKAELDPHAMQKNKVEELETYTEMTVALDQFKNILRKYIDPYRKDQKAWLVGFNNRKFDDVFLRKFFELCGDSFFGSWFWSDSQDVLVLASFYLEARRHKMKSFRLESVARELGIVVDVDRRHEARYDIYLLRQIYRIVTYKEIEI
jgi:DNA polymerase-3 subunit epsilon